MPDASERTASAEVAAVTDIEDEFGHEAIGLVPDFELADPHFYGAAVTETQAIAASPTDVTITNAGSAATNRLVLTFTGPITNPRLANLTLDAAGGFYVEALVSVAAGDRPRHRLRRLDGHERRCQRDRLGPPLRRVRVLPARARRQRPADHRRHARRLARYRLRAQI